MVEAPCRSKRCTSAKLPLPTAKCRAVFCSNLGGLCKSRRAQWSSSIRAACKFCCLQAFIRGEIPHLEQIKIEQEAFIEPRHQHVFDNNTWTENLSMHAAHAYTHTQVCTHIHTYIHSRRKLNGSKSYVENRP